MRWTGEDVKRMREHVGMTQLEFAAAVGITPTSVSMWELGKTRPSRMASKFLSATFGDRLDKLDEVAA